MNLTNESLAKNDDENSRNLVDNINLSRSNVIRRSNQLTSSRNSLDSTISLSVVSPSNYKKAIETFNNPLNRIIIYL